jgi:septum formation protein
MIILASSSKIRQQLLRQAGVSFTTVVSPLDEEAAKRQLGPLPAKSLAQALALRKAQSISANTPSDLVIGADQTLELKDQLFNKPRHYEEARQHLKLLRGQQHALHSAIVITKGTDTVFQNVTTAQMTMRNFSDDFLDSYLSPTDTNLHTSLGCYRIEAEGLQLFESIDGDYFTILGLALLPLLTCLRDIGEIPT